MTVKIGINGLGRIGRMVIRSLIESKNKNIEEATQIFLDRYSTKKKCLANSNIKVEPKGVQYELTWTIKNQIMKLMRPVILN